MNEIEAFKVSSDGLMRLKARKSDYFPTKEAPKINLRNKISNRGSFIKDVIYQGGGSLPKDDFT